MILHKQVTVILYSSMHAEEKEIEKENNNRKKYDVEMQQKKRKKKEIKRILLYIWTTYQIA